MANTSSVDVNFLRCPICLESFKHPRMFPCMHTFCEDCIKSYISNQDGATEERTEIKCYVCNRTTRAQTKGLDAAEWAKTFPINNFVFINQNINQNEERRCDPCWSKELHSTAKTFCKDCGELLCEECKKYHKMFKAFKSHSLVEADDAMKKPEKSLQYLHQQNCAQHIDVKVEYFCKNHEVLCCAKCVTADHRKCDSVTELEQFALYIAKNCKEDELRSKLTELYANLSTVIVMSERNTRIVKSRTNFILEKTKNIKDQINNMAAQFEDSIIHQCQQLNTKEDTVNAETRAKCESLKAAIQGSIKFLDAVFQMGNGLQASVTMQKILEQTKEYESMVSKEMLKVKEAKEVQLGVPENAEEFLRQEGFDLVASKNARVLVRVGQSLEKVIRDCES
ncbi:hypothetical protein CHS0354_009404 [Potamilus streckersoni]|uniref:Uncharacterized protein n=1 Tax=Potamilus streckersoni TaxID=2493646 RepID=A0AAE0W6M4_9BIVA|nr:hypothetical protein CHS0354_009404 [Potamilus streckersoni]